MPGKPAARVLDTVAHPLPPVLTGGPGSLTVLAGGQPAWRAASPAAVPALQASQKTSDTLIQVAETTAKLGAATLAGPALRLAAEAAKAAAAAAMGSAITAGAAGADIHGCLTPWPIPPHGPGLDIQGSPTVLVNYFRFGRQGDQLLEAIGGTNSISGGCVSVLVGAAGITGNVPAGTAACAAAAGGRAPAAGTVFPPGHPQAGQPIPAGTAGQSYNNCGCESSRQIINQATGAGVTQEGLLNQAMASGNANSVPGNLYASGGTTPGSMVGILAANGVPAHQEAPNMANLEAGAQGGQGVVVSVWAGNMPNWAGQGLAPNSGGHAVLVTGVQYDDNGNPINVIINDTGMGQCGQVIPYAGFQGALIGGANNHVVTNSPIW